MGLLIGGLTGVSSLKNDQEQAAIRSHESLKSQAGLLVDQFFGSMESGKALTATSGVSLPFVTHRASLTFNQGAPADFETFTPLDPSIPANAPDLAFENRVLTAIKSQLAIGDLKLTKQAFGTYELAENGTKQGIFLVIPQLKTPENGGDSTIEKATVLLIDPVKAFPGVQKLSAGEQTAFLIHKSGRVLNHTVSAFIGADLSKNGGLKDTIENLFLGAQTGAVQTYQNADGVRARVALVRAGVLPFAFAVEEKAPAPVLTASWFSEQAGSGAARKNFGYALLLLAIALVMFSIVSAWASREVEKQIAIGRESRKDSKPLPAIAPSLNPNRIAPSLVAAKSAPVEKAAESFVENRMQIREELETVRREARALTPERDYVSDLLSRIGSSATLEGIEKDLVDLSAELTESPILYFRYQRRNQSLSLSAVAGEVRIPNYLEMQAYVRKDIEIQIEQLAEGGRIASLNNYGPIGKLMIGQLNVAHFEAWGVTSSPEVSGQAKMTGVLVVLQAGMRSAQVRPTLARVLGEAGNYLYARSNKLESRAARNTKTVLGMDLESNLT
jgi:hypothetical protein